MRRKVFCACAINMASTSSYYKFLFSPHPGYSPLKYEVPRFNRWGCNESVLHVLLEEEGFSTAQVVAASNVSLSQCSTVGGQSIAISKPHSFISRSDDCVDVFTEAELIPYSPTPELLEETDGCGGALTCPGNMLRCWLSSSWDFTGGLPM